MNVSTSCAGRPRKSSVKVEQAHFEALMYRSPRQGKESLTDWFDRLMAIADDENKPRLPYREPGEHDE